MLDGLKLLCPPAYAARWLHTPELTAGKLLNGKLVDGGFALSVMPQTGEIQERAQRAAYDGLTFTLKPSHKMGYRCTITGSLHRYYNEGLTNDDRYTFAALQATITDLCQRFGLDASAVVVENIEIGVNLLLPFAAARVIDAVVVCHNKPFAHLNKANARLGKVCLFTEYEVKLYDKGKQAQTAAANLLRVEVKVKKMRYLNRYGIQTLADLTRRDRLAPLVALLTDALTGTLFLDTTAPGLDCLTDAERADFYRFRDPLTWSRNAPGLTFWKRQDYRARLTQILIKCNAYPFGPHLINAVRDEWQTLLDSPAPVATNDPLTAGVEALEKAMISPLVWMGESVANPDPERSEKEIHKNLANSWPLATCTTCGKLLTGQRKGSRFCSEKYNGKQAARQCRNRDSNPRRTKRNCIMKAKAQGQFLRITYTAPGGQTYTDILHSSEVGVSRADLDKIVSVSILADCPAADHSGPDCYGHCGCAQAEMLRDEPARALLADLTHQNAPSPQPVVSAGS